MLILSESLPECKPQMLFFFAFASRGREGTRSASRAPDRLLQWKNVRFSLPAATPKTSLAKWRTWRPPPAAESRSLSHSEHYASGEWKRLGLIGTGMETGHEEIAAFPRKVSSRKPERKEQGERWSSGRDWKPLVTFWNKKPAQPQTRTVSEKLCAANANSPKQIKKPRSYQQTSSNFSCLSFTQTHLTPAFPRTHAVYPDLFRSS